MIQLLTPEVPGILRLNTLFVTASQHVWENILTPRRSTSELEVIHQSDTKPKFIVFTPDLSRLFVEVEMSSLMVKSN